MRLYEKDCIDKHGISHFVSCKKQKQMKIRAFLMELRKEKGIMHIPGPVSVVIKVLLLKFSSKQYRMGLVMTNTIYRAGGY